MSSRRDDALAQSIRARLMNASRARGEEFNLILRRYMFERLLFRLGLSSQRGRYVLKGAMLLGI